MRSHHHGKIDQTGAGAIWRCRFEGGFHTWLTMADAPRNSSVYPSGGELTTASTAMLVPAPGRFSMMTGCPSRSESQEPMTRATVSAPPPGGNPTIQRRGLYGWAALSHYAIGSAGRRR